MSDSGCASWARGLTRRQFVATALSGAVGAAIAIPAAKAVGSPRASFTRAEPVVSFLVDQPYLDLTGRDVPYIPPRGLRSGTDLSALGDAGVGVAYGFGILIG